MPLPIQGTESKVRLFLWSTGIIFYRMPFLAPSIMIEATAGMHESNLVQWSSLFP